jgi:hypothetical protein
MEKIIWIDEYLEEALRLADDEGHESALKLLERLVYEEPGYGRLHNTLGVIYFAYADNITQAEQHFRLAMKFAPEFADSYSHLCQLLRQEERLDEAIEIGKAGLKIKQSNKSRLLTGVAQAYELKRQYNKAIRDYRDALEHSAELWNCVVLEASIKRCKRKQN